MTLRIALVDDQEMYRLGFRMLLETQEEVEVVGDGEGRGAQRPRCRRPEKGSDGPSSAFQLTIGDARRRAVQSHAIGLDNEVAGGER